MHFGEPKPLFDTVVIRFGGEIGIKGAWTRKVYERRLISNIKETLKRWQIPYDAVVRRFGRLYLKTPRALNATRALTKVFGISSLSPALETTSKINEIVERSVYLAHSILKKGNSFAVRCRRVGKHPYKSTDVCREVGRQILSAFPNLDLRVDLQNPDVTVGIEVRDDSAFIFTDVVEGVGGLPLGTQPKLICMLNGDVNSPVACWLVMKRGCPILPVYFNETPSKDEGAINRTLNVVKALFEWAIGFPRKVYIISHLRNLAEIEQKCPRALRSILSKRMMYRIAERIAEMKNAEGIVTGESIGERPSQTLRSLTIQDEAAERYPIHRPLLGLDRAEIEKLARKIGTYEASTWSVKKRKMALAKSVKPVELGDVKEAEAKLNIEEMVETSVKSLRVINL